MYRPQSLEKAVLEKGYSDGILLSCKEEKGKPFAKKEECFQSPLKHALHDKGYVLLRCFEMVPTLLLSWLTPKM